MSLFAWPFFAGIMGLLLLPRRPLAFPAAFVLWLAFVAWMATSGLMLVDSPREGLAKFAGNALLYLSATVLFLYAYRVAADPLRRRQLLLVGAGFFGIITAGGLLAVVHSSLSMTTPLQLLFPGLSDANPFIATRTTLDVAVEGWIGIRPRAPFGEVNEWGANYAIALPFAVAAAVVVPRKLVRWGLIALIALSVIPLIESQNRGAWGVVALLGAYSFVRFALPRLRRVPLRRLAAGAAAIAAYALLVVAVTSADEIVRKRVTTVVGGDTDRAATYEAAVELTAYSPIFGYGATQDSEETVFPVGTHGHGYRLLVSHGVPALLLFVGWFLAVGWQTRRGPPETIVAHVAIAAGLIAMFFYNLLPGQLHLLMLAAAIGLAARNAPAGRFGGAEGPAEA